MDLQLKAPQDKFVFGEETQWVQQSPEAKEGQWYSSNHSTVQYDMDSNFLGSEIRWELLPGNFGEVMTRMWLKFTMTLEYGEVYRTPLAYTIVDKITLTVDGEIIETVDMDWSMIKFQMHTDPEHVHAMEQVINAGYPHMNYITPTKTEDVTIHMPIDWSWSAKTWGFPLCALPAKKIYVNVLFNQGVDFSLNGVNPNAELSNVELVIEHMNVDHEARAAYQNMKVPINVIERDIYSIDYVDQQQEIPLTISTKSKVRALYWFFRMGRKNFDFSTVTRAQKLAYFAIMDRAKIIVNGEEITDRDDYFFRFQEPIKSGLVPPKSNIYTKSWALTPRTLDDNGYKDFSGPSNALKILTNQGRGDVAVNILDNIQLDDLLLIKWKVITLDTDNPVVEAIFKRPIYISNISLEDCLAEGSLNTIEYMCFLGEENVKNVGYEGMSLSRSIQEVVDRVRFRLDRPSTHLDGTATINTIKFTTRLETPHRMSLIDSNDILRKPLIYVDNNVSFVPPMKYQVANPVGTGNTSAIHEIGTTADNPYDDQFWNYKDGNRLYRSTIRSSNWRSQVTSSATVQSGRFLASGSPDITMDNVRRSGDDIYMDSIYWSDSEKLHGHVFNNIQLANQLFNTDEDPTGQADDIDNWYTYIQYDNSIEWISHATEKIVQLQFKVRVRPGLRIFMIDPSQPDNTNLVEYESSFTILELYDSTGSVVASYTNNDIQDGFNTTWEETNEGQTYITLNIDDMDPSPSWKLKWYHAYLFDVSVIYDDGISLKNPSEQTGTITDSTDQRITVSNTGSGKYISPIISGASASFTQPMTGFTIHTPTGGQITFDYERPQTQGDEVDPQSQGFDDYIYGDIYSFDDKNIRTYQVTMKAKLHSVLDPQVVYKVENDDEYRYTYMDMIYVDPEDSTMGVWQGLVNEFNVETVRVRAFPPDGREFIEIQDIQIDQIENISARSADTDILNYQPEEVDALLADGQEVLLDFVFDGKRLIYSYDSSNQQFVFKRFFNGDPSYLVTGPYNVHLLYQTLKYLEFQSGDVRIVA